MSLDNEGQFSIHLTGDVTGETWEGDFTAKKRLSHRDTLKKDNYRRQLLGEAGGMPTERAVEAAVMVSELEVRLLKWPDWWVPRGKGLDLEDDNILSDVWAKALKVEKDAADAVKAKAEANQKQLRGDFDKAKAEEKA